MHAYRSSGIGIILIAVLWMVGCTGVSLVGNSLPDEAVTAIRECLTPDQWGSIWCAPRFSANLGSWGVKSATKSPSPEKFTPILLVKTGVDELWCVVIDPPIRDGTKTVRNFFVYRDGLLWKADSNKNYSKDSFLRYGCEFSDPEGSEY